MIEQVKNKITDLLSRMGFEASVFERQEESRVVFNIKTADAQLLIGKQGANLDALQYILYLLLKREGAEATSFSLDVDDYKEKREIYIKEIARKAAHQARSTRRSVALPPMTGHERKIVHSYLSLFSDLISESTGEGISRRVIIKNKSMQPGESSDGIFEFIENT